jgi:sulfur-oxidizing protein SoxZ
MSNTIKVRAKLKGSTIAVKALINHPMETGLRKDKKTGKKIPPHFIQKVTCDYKGKTLLTALWGTAVSKNPFFSFKFQGAKPGDTLKISWVDNNGESDSIESKIK